MFASALPEKVMAKLGKIYYGQPLKTKSRKELLATIRPNQQKFLRADNGDLPDGWQPYQPAKITKTAGAEVSAAS